MAIRLNFNHIFRIVAGRFPKDHADKKRRETDGNQRVLIDSLAEITPFPNENRARGIEPVKADENTVAEKMASCHNNTYNKNDI